MSAEGEQLAFDLAVRPRREVHWLNAYVIEQRKLFGKKLVTEMVREGGYILPTATRIDVEKIGDLCDPDLRYALRFAAAAAAVGWRDDGYCLSGDSVLIYATDEGLHSHFISATYSGKVRKDRDTFMENLRSVAPHLNENH